MADEKISALLDGSPLQSGDEFVVARTGANYKIPGSSVLGIPQGLTGATQPTRFVGGTASGHPTTGTFAVGDFVIDQTGTMWICTAAGTPGTWSQVTGGGGGGLSSAKTTFSQPGVLATGTGTLRWLCPWTSATIQGSVAAVGTAPTGASVICDVKKNGTTIYTTSSNRPTIAAAANATTTMPTPDITALALGDYLTVDIDQVGSTVAGADLVLEILLTRTA